MHNKKKIEQEIEMVLTLKLLAEAYEEISVSRMQLVRSKVLSTREYIEKLSEVFSDVKLSYKKQLQKLIKKGKKMEGGFSFDTLSKNGREASILITANENFYGGLIKKVFTLFMEKVKQRDTDILVIGKVGKKFLDEAGVRGYKYIQVSDRNMSEEELKALLKETIDYQTVNVFYGQFQNMRSQIPVTHNISGDVAVGDGGKELDEKVNFYFEPSLERVFILFNNQVFSSILKQTLGEAELARLASRVWAMDEALTNIHGSHEKLKKDRNRVQKLIENKKQIQRVSGFLIWGQKGN